MAIYTGLLEKVKPTDDEIAKVMRHEITHALVNHQAEKMPSQLVSGLSGYKSVGIPCCDPNSH